MTKKTRYLLLSFGFLLFLLLAPLILFYVRGITYDFASHKFVRTGILAIKTEPKDAEIYINGELELKKSGSVRFLPTKEYEVTVRKDGYFDWSKRLPVTEGQVTWASPEPNKLYLFLKDPRATDIASGVLDFYVGNDFLLYLSQGELVYAQTNDLSRSENFPLPRTAASITASPNGQLFALTSAAEASSPTVMIFDRGAKTITDISNLFSSLPELKFSADNRLFALQDNILYHVDAKQQAKTAVKEGVAAFVLRENNLYFIGPERDGKNALFVSDLPENPAAKVLDGIPDFNKGQIFVNFERQVLLLLDGSLYKISSGLEKLASNITAQDFDYAESSLVFFHAGELEFYNPFFHNINFINRSGSPITDPSINLGFGNVFFIRDNRLETMELDSRDQQNNYVLYQGTDLQKFLLGPNLIRAYVLDDGKLKVLKIR